jgi:hypothetical protein
LFYSFRRYQEERRGFRLRGTCKEGQRQEINKWITLTLLGNIKRQGDAARGYLTIKHEELLALARSANLNSVLVHMRFCRMY